MASEFTIRAINDWRAVHGTSLRNALRVSMDVFGRTAEEACKHAMILMAQSAAKLSKQAPANRPIEKFGTFDFVWTYPKKSTPKRLFKWEFSEQARKMGHGLEGSWQQARRIAHRGLARRSWTWGQSRLGVKANRPMRGVVTLFDAGRKSNTHVGLILTNRLSYISKVTPPNLDATVSQRATSRIMKHAEAKMVRAYKQEVGKL
jgi:hypothetical protein